MRLVFFGTPQFAVPSLRGLIGHPEMEILAVLTQPDKRRGRGSQILASPVKQVAQAQQIPVWQPQNIKKDLQVLAQLRSLSADAFVVVAYGQILSPEILAMPRLGCINSHGSLLPKYRGAAPIQWALYQGEAQTGITTMLMDAGMDTGPMLLKATVPIDLFANAQDLVINLAALSPDLLIKTLQQLDQRQLEPTPQDASEATYAPLIQKPDYQLDWSRSAVALHNQVRGFYPNCLTQFRNTALKITATVPLQSGVQLPPDWQELTTEASQPPGSKGTPGEVVGVIKQVGPLIQTGTGRLLLREVQLAGKRLQSGSDFANGVRLEVGDALADS